MHYVWLGLLIASSVFLAITLLRHRWSWHWLGYAVMHVVVAAFLLYFINLAGSYFEFKIPVNVPTVATVLILGAPGLLMLIGLKVVLF
ncbi:pro-sigmaK processing inhibitor BofA family protein [Paenibacillus mesophilus]|uniref:pro-sigmaK processing inhibitor BofA family protein n=1 Tax=Paenibacillus mesophilus TaxID=2582849 RepID=UPI00130526AF|nr:pro-sigmaK processing inhibitor BofA family protein [Paenibacillus mesophilus]